MKCVTQEYYFKNKEDHSKPGVLSVQQKYDTLKNSESSNEKVNMRKVDESMIFIIATLSQIGVRHCETLDHCKSS